MVFKGDIVKVRELKNLPLPILFQAKEDLYQRPLPKYAIARAVSPGYTLTLTTVVYKGEAHSHYFNPETTVKVLTGRQGRDIMEWYETYLRDHISEVIHQPLSTSIGSDPEIFVEHGDGTIFPAFEFLKGQSDKDVFQKSTDAYSDGQGQFERIYWDGFQCEFNTIASTCMGWLSDSLQRCLKNLLELARKVDPKAKLSAKTLIEVPIAQLMAIDPKHAALGCDPSLNAYNLSGDLKRDALDVPVRSAGGHLHFGWGKLTPEKYIPCVKALDAILGVACVSLFERLDNPLRRQYYGLPGEFRLPPHGLEYRTLSNAWLFHPFTANLVFDLGRKAGNFGYNGFMKYWKGEEKETIETIMFCDAKRAREILDRNKDLFKQVIFAAYRSGTTVDTVYRTIVDGIESAVSDPIDIIRNWRLETDWARHCHNHALGVAYLTSNYLSSGKKV